MAVNMGNAVGYLDLDIAAFTAALAEAQQAANSGAKAIQTSFDGMSKQIEAIGKKVTSVGKTLSIGLTAPITAGIGASVKILAEFEQTMSRVEALSGATADELEKLSEKAQEMGATTKFSANDAAEAFTYMAQAGWKTEAMLDGIDGVMNLAAADGIELAEASSIVTSSLTGFGLAASDAARFADVLAVAASASNTDVISLGESFKYVAPVAGAAGYSIEDVATALGVMSNNGIVAGQAGTSLRAIISRLAAPTQLSAQYMEELGINIANTDGTMKSFDEVIGILRESFSGLTEAEQMFYAAEIFGQEAMTGVLSLINTSVDSYDELRGAIIDSDGAAQSMAETMQDNLMGQLEELKSALEQVAINVGQVLLPFIKSVVGVLQDWATALSELDPEQTEFIVKLGLIAAAVGPLTIGIGKLMASISTITTVVATAAGAFKTFATALNTVIGPVGIAITLVGLLVTAVYKYFTNTKDLDEATEDLNGTIEEYNRLVAESKTATDEASGSVDELTEANRRLLEIQARQQAADVAESYNKQVTQLNFAIRQKESMEGEYLAWSFAQNNDYNMQLLLLERNRAAEELRLLEQNATSANYIEREKLRTYIFTLNQMGGQSVKTLEKRNADFIKEWDKAALEVETKTIDMNNAIASVASAMEAGLVDSAYISLFSDEFAAAVVEYVANAKAAEEAAKAAAKAAEDGVASDESVENTNEMNSALEETKTILTELMSTFKTSGDYATDLSEIFSQLEENGITLSQEVMDAVIAALAEFNSELSKTEEEVPAQQQLMDTFNSTKASIEANAEAMAQLGLEYDSNTALANAAKTALNGLLSLPVEDRYEGWSEAVSELSSIVSSGSKQVTSSQLEIMNSFNQSIMAIDANARALEEMGISYDKAGELVDIYQSTLNSLLALPVDQRFDGWTEAVEKMSSALDELNAKTENENFLDKLSKKNQEWYNDTGKYISQVEGMYTEMSGYVMDITGAVFDYINQGYENQINELQEQIDMNNEMYEQQVEQEQDRYDRELAALKQLYADKKISDEEYRAQKNALEQQMTDFVDQKNKEKEASELALKQKQNELARKQFESNKAVQIAEVWINAAAATMRAFAENWWPIALGIAAAIATIAGVQTAAIASQQFTPMFAKGGIVDKPTLGIFGEAGKEAIVPLERNTEWMDILEDRMMKAIGGAANAGYNIVFNSPKAIDAREASRLMKRTVRDLAEGF